MDWNDAASQQKQQGAVNAKQISEQKASVMTDRFVNDDQVVEDLLNQIDCPVDQFTGDGAYDKNPVYELFSTHSAAAEIIIPPDSDAKYDVNKNHAQRSQNTVECQAYG